MSRKEQSWDADRALYLIEGLAHCPGALLPILHTLQDEFGYIDKSVIDPLAKALNLSRAEVHGVLTFYHDFRTSPPGRHVLRMCRAEACQSMGCEGVIRHVLNRLEVNLGDTSRDGSFTVEPVYCLGNCALSPAVLLDGKLYGRVSADVADLLIDDARGRA